MKTNAMTVIDRTAALAMPHPNMGYAKKGRKPKEDSSFLHFDANRTGIAVMRRRDFTWAEIHTILKNFGVEHSYPSLILWKNTHFDDPVKMKEERKLAKKMAKVQAARSVSQSQNVDSGVPRRRGRPPGSKNKEKIAA